MFKGAKVPDTRRSLNAIVFIAKALENIYWAVDAEKYRVNDGKGYAGAGSELKYLNKSIQELKHALKVIKKARNL